jgi:hypothetical protein
LKNSDTDSRNDLLEEALRHQLTAFPRAAIDAEFAQMASDRDYQEEAVQIAEDFANADWEALRTFEKKS